MQPPSLAARQQRRSREGAEDLLCGGGLLLQQRRLDAEQSGVKLGSFPFLAFSPFPFSRFPFFPPPKDLVGTFKLIPRQPQPSSFLFLLIHNLTIITSILLFK